MGVLKIMAEGLTERERQVLILVAQGKANKEIGRELCIAVRTAEYHITNILGKLGAANRTEAVVKALRQGLLTSQEISGADKKSDMKNWGPNSRKLARRLGLGSLSGLYGLWHSPGGYEAGSIPPA